MSKGKNKKNTLPISKLTQKKCTLFYIHGSADQ